MSSTAAAAAAAGGPGGGGGAAAVRRPTVGYRRSNTSINLSDASGLASSGLYSAGIIDKKYGAPPSRDTMAVLNGGGSGVGGGSGLKDFLMGRSGAAAPTGGYVSSTGHYPPPIPAPDGNLTSRYGGGGGAAGLPLSAAGAGAVVSPAYSAAAAVAAAAEPAYSDEYARLASYYPRQPKYSYLVSRTKPEYFGRRDDYLSYLTPSTNTGYELPSVSSRPSATDTYLHDILGYQPSSSVAAAAAPAPAPPMVSSAYDPILGSAQYGQAPQTGANAYADDAVNRKLNQVTKSKSYSNFDAMRRDQNQVSTT